MMFVVSFLLAPSLIFLFFSSSPVCLWPRPFPKVLTQWLILAASLKSKVASINDCPVSQRARASARAPAYLPAFLVAPTAGSCRCFISGPGFAGPRWNLEGFVSRSLASRFFSFRRNGRVRVGE